jgi:glyoxylase-like metal-dependent hydrolase (beta-lactamase superfamily II)
MTSEKDKWFTIERIDDNTSVISEYKHWEETHCYVLNGTDRCLLIDTGLGIENILDQVKTLTDKPITAVATHVHYDHIGGHKYFSDFYVHEAEVEWINGGFPLTIEQVRDMLVEEPCDFPKEFDVNGYHLFEGVSTRVLKDRRSNIHWGSICIFSINRPNCLYEFYKEAIAITGE